MLMRDLALGTADTTSRTVPVTLSTETPVNCGSYIEILDHGRGSVDLSRSPLPLIESHDSSELNIGLVEDLKLVGRTLKGVARFGNSQRAQEVFQDVVDGIIRNVSIGYEYIGPGVPESQDSVVLRFKFRPVEVSAVSIPADPNAGFFRNKEIHMNQNNTEQNILSRSQRRAAAGENERMALSNELERARCTEIFAMGKAHNCAELAEDLVNENATIDQARQTVLDHVTRNNRQRPLSSGRSDFLDMGNEAKDFSIVRAISASMNNDWRGAGLERAASDAIAKRLGRQSTGGFFVPMDVPLQYRTPYAQGTLGTGGAVVETQLLAENFIEVLRNRSQVMSLGATVLSGLVGMVDIPRRTVATPAYWVGEAGAVTEGEGTFDKISLSPKAIGALSQYSRNMVMQSTPAIEMLVRADLAAVLGLGIDLAAINGLGTGNQPTGIMNTAGIGSVVGGVNGAQVSIDNLVDLATTVANANGDIGALAYLTNPKVLGFVSKIKATTGQYLWQRGEGGPNYAPVGGSGNNLTVLGNRLAISNQVPSNLTKGTSNGVCSAIVYGNWNDLIIGEWSVLEIAVNPYDSTGFTKGSVFIRAMQSIDIGVRHAASFAAMVDALTV